MGWGRGWELKVYGMVWEEKEKERGYVSGRLGEEGRNGSRILKQWTRERWNLDLKGIKRKDIKTGRNWTYKEASGALGAEL